MFCLEPIGLSSLWALQRELLLKNTVGYGRSERMTQYMAGIVQVVVLFWAYQELIQVCSGFVSCAAIV